MGDAENKKDEEHDVEKVGPPGEGDLNGFTAAEGEPGHEEEENARSQQGRKTEGVPKDASRSCAHNPHNEKKKADEGDFVKNPPLADELFKKGAVVIGFEGPGKFEGEGEESGPDYKGEPHAHKPAGGPVLDEVLHQFPSRTVAAGNEHRLCDKSGQQIFLVPAVIHEKC